MRDRDQEGEALADTRAFPSRLSKEEDFAKLEEMLHFYKERAATAEEVAEVLRNQVDEMLYNQDAASDK